MLEFSILMTLCLLSLVCVGVGFVFGKKHVPKGIYPDAFTYVAQPTLWVLFD